MATGTRRTELDGLRDWSPVVMRVALGVVMLVNGAAKLLGLGPETAALDGVSAGFAAGIPTFTQYLRFLGVPYPGVMAWMVTFVEFFGGLFLILGVLTRLSATFITVNMLVATYLVHLQNGWPSGNGGYEYTLVLALLGISLVLSGPGRLSVEKSVLGTEMLSSRVLSGYMSREKDKLGLSIFCGYSFIVGMFWMYIFFVFFLPASSTGGVSPTPIIDLLFILFFLILAFVYPIGAYLTWKFRESTAFRATFGANVSILIVIGIAVGLGVVNGNLTAGAIVLLGIQTGATYFGWKGRSAITR